MNVSLPLDDARVFLPFRWFANTESVNLGQLLRKLTPRVERVPDGYILGPAVHKSTFRISTLCDQRNITTLDERWESAFGHREVMFISDEQTAEFRVAADQHLKQRDFGWFAWRPMMFDDVQGGVLDQALAVHRDVLFPAFFSAYPGGRILAVTYEQGTALDGFLSAINILNRARRVGFDEARLLGFSGRDPMEWVGLHHPVYYPWYAVFLAFAVMFPHLHGFVASLQHQGFLVYLLPSAERFKDEEPSEFERTMPGLTMAKTPGMTDESGDVRFRRNPFGQARSYSVDDLESYIRVVVHATERMLHNFADLTRYPSQFDSNLDAYGSSLPLVDLGFARNTLLTLFVLLRRTIKNTFKSDTFDRMMSFYEIIDLHTSLITTNPQQSAEEFKRLLSRDYALGHLTHKLQGFPGAVGADLVSGLADLRRDATSSIADGVLLDWNGTTVSLPKRSKFGVLTSKDVSLDEYETALLRAFRNTKHGYATNDADLLATHTGEIDEDFPDYALALMLAMLMDSSEYKLKR